MDQRTLDGSALRDVMVRFHELLVSHREHLNGLNVYPVPDADTGANLSMTVQSVVDSLRGAATMGDVCAAIRRGALTGARGASGVIMSELLGTFASRVGKGSAVSAPTLAAGLEAASAAADRAVLHPVEGTILTVARDAASAAAETAAAGATAGEVLATARKAAVDSLEGTTDQLAALCEADVVDAGGYGYVLFLDALLNVVAGTALPDPPAVPAAPERAGTHSRPRYEIVVRLAVDSGVLADFRGSWGELGNNSTIVVEREGYWLAHIHTDHPEAAMEAAQAAGAVHEAQVTDLEAQVRELRDRPDKGQ